MISEEERKKQEEWLSIYREQHKEALKRYNAPEVVALVRIRCRDWLDLAKAVVDEYGEKGKELVKKTRYATAPKFAQYCVEKYGRSIEALLRGYYDVMPWYPPSWDMFLGELPDRLRMRMECHVGDYFNERIKEDPSLYEPAKIFCDWDYHDAPAINPKIKYERTKWICDSDLFCEHVWEMQK